MMTAVSTLTLFPIILIIGCSKGVEDKSFETNEINNYLALTNINFLFDLFLKKYTEKLVETGRTEVQVPGFQRRFSTNIMSVEIVGAVVVNDGWCSNLSSIHRTGDADITRDHTSAVLTAHLGLRELKIHYNSYNISIVGVYKKGNIRVNVGENSVWVKLKAEFKPKCDVTLTDMKIEKLDNINVDISNLGIFEDLTDIITSWVANEVTTWYKGYIEQIAFPELADIVKNADLCHYI